MNFLFIISFLWNLFHFPSLYFCFICLFVKIKFVKDWLARGLDLREVLGQNQGRLGCDFVPLNTEPWMNHLASLRYKASSIQWK